MFLFLIPNLKPTSSGCAPSEVLCSGPFVNVDRDDPGRCQLCGAPLTPPSSTLSSPLAHLALALWLGGLTLSDSLRLNPAFLLVKLCCLSPQLAWASFLLTP